MKTIFTLLISVSFILPMFTSCDSHPPEDKALIKYAKENDFPVKSNDARNADPAILFCYSNQLWKDGQKYDAVFWYYVAQYRCRILSSCSENLQAGSIEEEMAKDFLLKTGVYENKEDLEHLHLIGGAYRIDLYETIQAVLGKTINGYSYGDLEQMKATLDRLLEHEKNYPFNPMGLYAQPVFKSDDIVAEKLVKVRNSYIDQKQQITDDADNIRVQRAENGLENR